MPIFPSPVGSPMPILAASLPFLGEVVVLFALSAFVAYLIDL